MKDQNEKTIYSGEQVIEAIRSKRQEALRVMYPRYQNSFMRWARSWNQSMDDDTLIEAYMEAIKVFYTNVITGHLSALTSSVENYLISIGKNFLMNKYQKSKNTELIDDFSLLDTETEEDILSQIIFEQTKDEQLQALRTAMSQLGDKCQMLLKLFYFEDVKPSEILDLLGYSDLNTVYVSKSKCLAHLRKLILNMNINK